MKRIIIALLPCISLLLVACRPHIMGNELPPTPYEEICITVVKFKDNSLCEKVLVSKYRTYFVINRSKEMVMIDSISSTHVDCPFIPLRNGYHVIHWRWMGETGLMRTINKTSANLTYSCLDNVRWEDVEKVSQIWDESEPHTSCPFQEIYQFFISELDKRLGIYYDSGYRPQYDSLWGGNMDKRLPFLPKEPLRYYTRESIGQYIQDNDSIFNVYLQVINQIFDENSQVTIWNN